jgi:hypothetical protein
VDVAYGRCQASTAGVGIHQQLYRRIQTISNEESAMAEAAINVEPPVKVDRWSSERPLLVLVWLTAIGLWIALAVSLIGIAYAAFLGIFFFAAHIMFITSLRGNAVRLSPEQMPELYKTGRVSFGADWVAQGAGRLCHPGRRNPERPGDQVPSLELHRSLL